jgi:hypothetical protein
MLSHLRRAFLTQRFFSTLSSLSNPFIVKESSLKAMVDKYPKIMQCHFDGLIAYCLRGETPEELRRAGALYPWVKELWLSNTGSGDNTGSVCFSLLPEVTTLFTSSASSKGGQRQPYLYAFPLHGNFLVPGGRWRQIISPGAFPLPAVWRARQLLGVESDKIILGRERVKLGPLTGAGEFKAGSCPRFLAYLNEAEHLLIKPQELPGSDDFPQEFDIEDSESTEAFQSKVEAYYQAAKAQTEEPRVKLKH